MPLGGGSQTTTTETTNEPPEWAKPLFVQSAKKAQQLFDSGAGFHVYNGPVVANLSKDTRDAMQQMRRLGDVGSRAINQANGIYRQAGRGALDVNTGDIRAQQVNTDDIRAQQVGTQMYDPVNRSASQLESLAQRLLGGIAGGREGIKTEADYRKVLSSAEGPTAAASNLADMASGKYLTQGNPYFNELLNKQSEDLAGSVNNMFASGGRYGSAANQGTVLEEVGDFRTRNLADQWNRDSANQLIANQMIDAANSQQIADRLAAVAGITNVQGQNISNQMRAADSMIGANTSALNAILGAAQGRADVHTGNADRALEALGLKKDVQSSNADRVLEALGLKKQVEQSNVDTRLAGAAGLQSTGQQKFDNAGVAADAALKAGSILDQRAQAKLENEIKKFYQQDMRGWTRLGALQAAAAGAAGDYGTTWSQTQQPSQSFNPLGLLGLLGSFAKSDIRAKTDIEPTGVATAGGHALYRFRYIGDPEWHVGVMAQEVMRTQPDAVMEVGGVLGVFYGVLD